MSKPSLDVIHAPSAMAPITAGHGSFGGSAAAALDIGAHGIRAATSIGETAFPIPLGKIESAPSNLLTFRFGAGAAAFPSLMEQLGEEGTVRMGTKVDRPQGHLKSILAELRPTFESAWGPIGEVACVVSGFATDLQRSLVQRAFRGAGWGDISLVNRTTAAALYALTEQPAGHYLSIALGYSAAEASVIYWDSRQLRAMSYSSERSLSGAAFDFVLMAEMLTSVGQARGQSLSIELYDQGNWMELRDHAEQIRVGLDAHRKARWRVPQDLVDGGLIELLISREVRDTLLAQSVNALDDLVLRACKDASIETSELRGWIASGGLIGYRPLRERFLRLTGARILRIVPSSGLALGAVSLLVQERRGEVLFNRAPIEEPEEFVVESLVQAPISRPVSPQAAGQCLRDMFNSGRRQDVKDEVLKLVGYVSAPIPHQAPAAAQENPASLEMGSADPAPSPTETRKGSRTSYLVAREFLKKAEVALQQGNLDYAVGLSHQAYQKSSDHRIFEAMLKVHVLAATSRKPTLQTFEDDRKWLLCALRDDPTNEHLKSTLIQRYLVQTKQLVDVGTSETHLAGISLLAALREGCFSNEQVDSWFDQLNLSRPGTIQLSFPDTAKG